MKRLPKATWALIVVNVTLAGLVTWRLMTLPSISELHQQTAVPEISIPRLPDRVASAPVDYDVIRSQVLFQPRREFFVAPDPLTAPGAARPQYEFVAAMVMPQQKSVAYLKQPGAAQPLKVKLGDPLEGWTGWTITVIETRRVVVERGSEQLEFAQPTAPGLMRVQGTQAADTTGQTGGTRVLSAGTPAAATVPRVESSASKPRTYRPPPQN